MDAKRHHLPSRLTTLNPLAVAEALVAVVVSHASCSPVNQNLLADAVLQLEAVDVQRLLLLHQHP